jgi:hypothetical protein
MDNNPLGDVGDKLFELGQETGKKFVRDVVKGVPKSAKGQIFDQGNQGNKDKQSKKTDPVTGKPIPSKKALTQLTQATAQLQQAKLQKVREELDKQRLKVADNKQKLAPIEAAKTAGKGPVMAEPGEQEKAPPPEAVTATLRGSKSTGEFGRQVGG